MTRNSERPDNQGRKEEAQENTMEYKTEYDKNKSNKTIQATQNTNTKIQ